MKQTKKPAPPDDRRPRLVGQPIYENGKEVGAIVLEGDAAAEDKNDGK